MLDVAQHAGVSLKTVSRVVNGESGVSPQKLQRVQASIDLLGYRRNDGARTLRSGRSQSIGLVLENVADPFDANLMNSVEEAALERRMLLIVGSSHRDYDRERDVALALCARWVDGLIIIPSPQDHAYLQPEAAAGTAIVFVDRPALGLEADVVLADNEGGAAEGVAHLIAQGHRRIAYIGDRPELFTSAQRMAGYRKAHNDAGLPLDESLINVREPTLESVAAALDAALTATNPATAVFCGNNRVTLLVMRLLPTLIRRPAIVGFDDLESAALASPAVTVVAQDPALMGRRATELLLARCAGESGPPETVILPTTLLERKSGALPDWA